MVSRAYRRADVSGASPEPGPSSNQGSRQSPSDGRLDAHAPRPGRAEIRRDHTGLGTLVRRCLQFCAASVPPCGLAGALCSVCAAIPAAGGVQWIHALPAGDEQDHHTVLDSGARGYGRNNGLGRHGDRGRFQPLFLASAVLPPAGRVRVGLHVFQADHGLCHRGVGHVSGDKPHRWGRNRHGGKGREAPAGPDLRHVCGGGNGQPDLQLRAEQVEGRGGAGAGPSAGADRALPSHSRYDGADRLHDRPGDRRGQTGCRRLERGAPPPGSTRPHGFPRPPSGS